MKIKQEHLDILINSLAVIKPRIVAAIPSYKSEKLSLVRLQWDSLRACSINGNSAKWICDELYTYMNDNHIQTALNAAFKKLDINY